MSDQNLTIRKLNTLHGWKWIADGFRLFKRSPVIWIALLVIYLLIGMLLSTAKVIGPIILNLLAPVFVAGFMVGCRALEKGDELEINHLFAGFRHQAAQLITVGGIYLVGVIAIAGVVFAGADTNMLRDLQNIENLSPQRAAELNQVLLPMLLTVTAALLPLVMAYWFAPVLVAFHHLSALKAMKLSFIACLRNMLPFLIYSLIAMVFLILAALPLFLGMLVMIPTMIASLYTSYRDVFVADEAVVSQELQNEEE